MLFTIQIIIFCIAAVSPQTRVYPSISDVDYAHGVIDEIIDSNAVNNRQGVEFPFIAGYVRLAFHDCVGGCDGCVNHNLDSNKGLKVYTDALDTEYGDDGQINGSMSRADFYMLAGWVALERANPKIFRSDNFKVGRISCATNPVSSTTPSPGFPKGINELGDLDNFFSFHFPSFTDTDKVAIMGAHSLGRCREENSGFEGKWIRGIRDDGIAHSDFLDNEYYKQIRGNWTQVDIEHNGITKKQWQRPGISPNDGSSRNRQPNMFLNIDVSLQWDLKTIGTIESDGSVQCKIDIGNRGVCLSPDDDCCKVSKWNTGSIRSGNLFKKFVNSSDFFIDSFIEAYTKMSEREIISATGDLQMPN